MIDALYWYLIISILGWISFPIAYRFLGKLPDRGLSLAKPLAMLIWAFIFWILGSYGVLGNDLAGLLVALFIFSGISFWVYKNTSGGEIGQWLRENALLVLAIEVLFFVAFTVMAILRANYPDAVNTEKPMELAFINAILQSPAMPPNDPWLSGYSISYYYFGFLMISMIARIASTLGSVAFNLGLALTFAMAAVASYGLAFNLLSVIREEKKRANVWAAFLAPLFVLIMGNVEGFLEILHARHIFWNVNAEGAFFSRFWAWLDIRDLVNPPSAEATFQPRMYGTGNWWWWRASRVVNDVNFLGIEQELIDEFPAFSFVLGDLHPHVMSIPYAFLATGLAFNHYLGGLLSRAKDNIYGLHINWINLLFASLVLGGLAFLNIWDFPIYLVLFAGTYALVQANRESWHWQRLIDFGKMFFALGLGGVLLYLPFYLGFSSQAGGFLPNLLNPTRGAHLWVMFGLFFLPLLVYFVSLWAQDKWSFDYLKGIQISSLFILALWGLSLLLAWIFANFLKDTSLGLAILKSLDVPNFQSLFTESIARRASSSGGWLTLLLMLGLPLGALIHWAKSANKQSESVRGAQRGIAFLLVLAIFAALLVLAPEFVFLRDHFGTRMNTVFKFYMQAWLVFATLAAVVSVLLLANAKGIKRAFAALLVFGVLGVGLIYPAYAFPDRYRPREGRAASLDAASFLSAEEQAAVDWLRAASAGTLAEAVGAQYSSYARYATQSGKQGVLGWPGHEGQWRGGSVNFYPREGDLEVLYASADWDRANEIIERYDIRYIVVGILERMAYQVNEIKFQNNLRIAFQNAAVTIYQAAD